MSMVEHPLSHNIALPGVHPSSSHSRPHAGRVPTPTTFGFAKISAVTLAAHRASVLVRAKSPSGDDAGKPSEASSELEKTSNMPQKPGGLNLSLPNIPIWAKWVLGSVVVLSLPFYKKFMSIEDEVEKTVETAVEVAEEVAKVTKKMASDLTEALPSDASLRKVVVEVEEIAERAIADSEKTKCFIHKVDEIKEEVEALVEEKEAEIFGKEKQ